ncbi:AAA family ATPase [Dysosmobacter welbionis]|uniref:AAA family ATPase n=1 Tax=Dysosmobacter welbionis TaxID=2093857 RepID=UPI003A9152E1
MDVHDVLSRLQGVKGGGGQWSARCPAHDDKRQSLSISQGKDGQVLLKCHAGCTVESITSALGIEVKDLFQKQERPHVIATYTYPTGAQKLRYSDKHFSWRHPDGKGGWVYNRKGVPHSLYVAGDLSGVVFVVEGEKDADNLHKLGYDAVSGEDGASPGKWRKEYTEQLKGRPVVIFQDNDQVGKDYAQETASALSKVCPMVKVLDLKQAWPKLPEKGDVSDLIAQFGPEKAVEMITALIDQTPLWTPAPDTKGRKAKAASSFGEDNTSFLWFPYLPIGDYTVMMADGGTGKTVLCCGIAAAVSRGKHLPGEEFDGEGQNVLMISAEDSGEILKKRLSLSGADLNRVFILDRSDSLGMSFSDGYEEFADTVKAYKPALVIIDPWHNYLGDRVDMNRANAIRPVFQQLSNLAKVCDCAMILVSHVNKRAQGENANYAATGSNDLTNAARSAVRVIFDEMDEDCRIMVHTKTNYAAYGQSVKYRIVDGGVKWEGFSDVTRQTLEAAARRKSTPWEVMQKTEERENANNALVEALESAANQFQPTRFSYEEFKREHGDLIFGGLQPKRALDAVRDRLTEDGFFLKTGIQVKKNGDKGNGFMVQRIDAALPEQVPIGT